MRYALYILLIVLTFSCGAKKKAVQRGSETVSELRSESFNRLTVDNTIRTKDIVRVHVSTFRKTGTRITLKSNGNGPIRYNDGKRDITVSGADVIIEDYDVIGSVRDSVSGTASEQNNRSDTIKKDSSEKVESKKTWRNVRSFILRIPTMFWLFLLILILIIIYYRYRR